MGFWGLSTSALGKVALGFAGSAKELLTINSLDLPAEEKQELLRRLGLPKHIDLLTIQLAEAVSELRLGWLKKNQLVGMVRANLLKLGVSASDANYLAELVELAIEAHREARKGLSGESIFKQTLSDDNDSGRAPVSKRTMQLREQYGVPEHEPSDGSLDATCPNCGSRVLSTSTKCRTCNTQFLGSYRPR